MNHATTSAFQTSLFAGSALPTAPRLTPRAAFQSALYGRISLVDSRIPRHLACVGAPVVDLDRDVVGGFAAWVRDGMPLARG